MMTEAGPKVLEFNVRLGDPETQPLMHRMDSGFGEVLMRAATGELKGAELRWKPEPSVCVVMAAAGYPGQVRTGDRIEGIEDAEKCGAEVFQAGTAMPKPGPRAPNGGRQGAGSYGVGAGSGNRPWRTHTQRSRRFSLRGCTTAAILRARV